MTSSPPADAVAAVTHPDPYPFYAALRQRGGLSFDAGLKLWVAADAAAAAAVLAEPRLRVRPPGEPVPAAIAGSAAGALFGRLVRMNEGAAHAAPKRALERALASVAPDAAAARTHRLAQRRLGRPPAEWTFELPVTVVASLLGFEDDALPDVAAAVADFVACLSPLSTPPQLAAAAAAAERLVERLQALLQADRVDAGTMAGQVIAAAREVGWADAGAIVANLAGLLSQTYEATAGLIGNAIVAWQRAPQRAADRAFVDEVARHDAPVQNTRRFAAADVTIGDQVIRAGDAVLVLIASANRDPALNAEPDRFIVDRPQRRLFTFGHACHACPGHALAATIAATALQALLERGPLPGWTWRYRPSANGRIPVFN
jgi:cytochrome P450